QSIASGTYGAGQAPVVFGIGLDQTVYESRFDAAGNLLGGWVAVAPGKFESIVVGSYGPSKSPMLFGIGTTTSSNRQVFAARFDSQAHLINGFFPVAPGVFFALTVGNYGAGNPEVFGVSLQGRVYATRFDANGNIVNGWFLVAPGSFTSVAAANRTNGTLDL